MRSSTLLLSLPLVAIVALTTIALSSAGAQPKGSPSDQGSRDKGSDNKEGGKKAAKKKSKDDDKSDKASSRVPTRSAMASLTVFVLAIFIGFELITKVPPTLHTPLMSGSNAISGITVVGAVLVAGSSTGGFSSVLGLLAVILATVNVVGGFLVTHRMLSMFQKR
jgi:NAD(P) transhydrogenase subunit alpha